MREITYTQALVEAFHEELDRDPNVIILGEDIKEHWPGLCGEFKGLYEKYGSKRVIGTPISETAIIGGAIGAAAVGIRPVAFLGLTDFMYVADDEIHNQLTKMRYMFGGKIKLPLTIYASKGAGLANAAQHSESNEGYYMSIPGLKIASPSTPYDAKGLLKSAIREDNPVMYCPHLMLMFGGIKGEVPEEEYTVPLGKADVKRQGSDVTVVAISLMVHRALAVAAKLQEDGTSIEVVDPRTLVPLDIQAIINSVKKTGRLVIMDEEPKTGSAAAEISAKVGEEAFEYLKAPIKRVCAPDTPVPYSPILEKYWMPDEENLIEAINELI